jgi:GH25 family lysozyme M1 (1,4-beta-N-acetylmuramidase)
MSKLIIDVSQWQGVINWDAVKPHIDGAILRMGFGSDQVNQDDMQWERNVSECVRLGIPWGAYIYSYANTPQKAQSEIQHTLRLLKGKKPQLPVYFDAEDVSIRAYCHASFPEWDAAVKAAGYKTGLYSGYYFRRECMPAVNPDTWWLAWYNGTNGTKKPLTGNWIYDAWQFKSDGIFPGISGRVDTNYFYRDFSDSAPISKPAPVPAASSSPRLDLEIQCLNRGRSGKKVGGGELCMYDDAITGLSIGVTGGWVEYRVHKMGGGWFSRITKCDWGTPDAYAGDLHSMIDGVQIYFHTDPKLTGGKYYRAKYQVKTQHHGWLGEIYDTDFASGDGNTTAGIFGDPIIGIRAKLV